MTMQKLEHPDENDWSSMNLDPLAQHTLNELERLSASRFGPGPCGLVMIVIAPNGHMSTVSNLRPDKQIEALGAVREDMMASDVDQWRL